MFDEVLERCMEWVFFEVDVFFVVVVVCLEGVDGVGGCFGGQVADLFEHDL